MSRFERLLIYRRILKSSSRPAAEEIQYAAVGRVLRIPFLHFLNIVFFLCCAQQLFAQTPQKCEGLKQILFVVDVSGSMKTNDRLGEVKQFALRTLKERASENLLYKIISFGGTCNDLAVEADWTRDVAVLNAAIKGLYVRGSTPLGSAVEFAIDEIKKSAYPDETHVYVLGDGENICGTVKEILARRAQEIPCVRISTLGLELQESEQGLRDSTVQDFQLLASQTSGRYLLLEDVRELRGVSLRDTGMRVQPVEFERRLAAKKKKTEAASQQVASQSPQNNTAQGNTSQNNAQPAVAAQQTSSTATTQDSSSATTKPRSETVPQQASRSDTPQQQTQQQSSSSTTTSQTQPQAAVASEKSVKAESSPLRSNTRAGATETSSETPQNRTVAQKRPSKKQAASNKKQAEKAKSTKQLSAQEPPMVSRTVPETRERAPDAPSNTSANAQRSTPQNAPTQANTSGAVEMGIGKLAQTPRVFQFYSKSTALVPASEREWMRFVEELRQLVVQHPQMRITVEGHSSQEGSAVENLRLAVSRASAIAAALRVNTGLRDTAVKWNAYGALRPAANDLSFWGRERNRRVEVFVEW